MQFTPEFFDNPYPTYQFLRENHPVMFSAEANGWFVSRYHDVQAILKDRRFSNHAPMTTGTTPPELIPHLAMLQEYALNLQDPPNHTRLRSLIHKAFTPRIVEQLRGKVQSIADELLDAAEKKGGMEVIKDFSFPLPVRVILELVGAPVEDQDQIKRWCADFTLCVNPIATDEDRFISEKASAAFIAYLGNLIELRRKSPQDDLLSSLVMAEEQGDKLTQEEIITLCNTLILAGHETTTHLIGNGLLALLKNPDQLALLRQNPALLPTAIEELLRYDSPAQLVPRIAMEDIDICGNLVQKGQQVIVIMWSANHDPEVFENPDGLDITRKDNPHLSLGNGIHYCVGAPLARMEAQIVFETLLRRFPTIKLVTEQPQRVPTLILRQLQALEVSF